MAKKDKDAAYQSFLEDLKSVVGDEHWASVEENLIKNEKAAAKLKTGVLAQSEFSSQMDALRAERDTFAEYQKQEKSKIEGWQKWYGETTQEVAKVQDELKQYRETYGDLEPGEQRRVAREAGYLTKDEFQKALSDEINKRDMANLKFADDLTDIKMDYRERFKEKLPIEEVYKLAGEHGTSLEVAYELFIADKVEEQRKEEFTAAIDKAKKEAVAEYASQHNLPVVPSNSDVVHTLDVKNPGANSRDRVAAAMKTLNDLRISGR